MHFRLDFEVEVLVLAFVIFVPTFDKNRIFVLGVADQNSETEIIVFTENFLCSFKETDFLQHFGSLKLKIWPCSGLIYLRFVDFTHPESVTQLMYAWGKISHYKVVPY